MRLQAILILAVIAFAPTRGANPSWYEPTDSAAAIRERLLRDFPYDMDEALIVLREKYPEVTADSIPGFIAGHYIETMEIDGEHRMFRKSPRNLGLLHPWRNGGWNQRGWNASPQRRAIADSALRGQAQRVRVRFTVTVPPHPALQGDSIRVWLPYPIESERQSDVQLLCVSNPRHFISHPTESTHRSIYFCEPASTLGPNIFSYEAQFTCRSLYLDPDSILNRLRPYDTSSAEYIKYTAMEAPHIVALDSLAHAIVGSETNPLRQSEMVYDYIVGHYPWAGAREYSTIPCIPRYVIDRGYGDCGQVTLLYISLMRSLGVPARWESGFMLHPGEVGMHDWGEVYFEGVGWVPVDVSFGRYLTASDPKLVNFYSTGIDAYRMAVNRGVCGQFDPSKRHLRSETVDFQAGEVETSAANLFYPGWSYRLEILDCQPLP